MAPNVYDVNVRVSWLSRRVRSPLPDAARDYHVAQTTHWVVFIHGFANSPKAAAKKYQIMMQALAELTGIDGSVDPQIAYLGFHWPGNHPLPIVDQVTFPRRFKPASAAGIELARWLRSLPSSGHVTLVAHSLGCRVALACVAELMNPTLPGSASANRVSLPNVVLMAGAVRRHDCTPLTARFGPRYPQARYTNLYSYYDRVLQLGFPGGAVLVGGPGRAIGLRGEPVQGRWDARMSTDLGHSGYWNSRPVGSFIASSMLFARIQLLAQSDLPAVELANADLYSNQLDSETAFRS